MKKIATIILIIAIPLAVGSWYSVARKKSVKTETIKYTLENKTYNLLTAKTQEEWEKGLMFLDPTSSRLRGVNGMIFIFPDKQVRTFWNKNTYVDLDLYWLNDEKITGKSELPSIEKSKKIVTVNSSSPVNKVIEIIK
ncbi:MAG: DUF192 domain-containing protein [Candidatus Roizmanbacteria bacterium]|nr:MAG: DUF192 domain-containing protein [Candidatus Roizmanbacteria bacterium]